MLHHSSVYHFSVIIHNQLDKTSGSLYVRFVPGPILISFLLVSRLIYFLLVLYVLSNFLKGTRKYSCFLCYQLIIFDLRHPLCIRSYSKVHREASMAGHSDSGTSEKKSSDMTDDIPTFNAENLQNNMKMIYYRYVMAI